MEDKVETIGQETSVGEMHKRRETMADGKRYIIYYSFGGEAKISEPVTRGEKAEGGENV